MIAPDVVVIGAGLAGLGCARRLAACGVSFQLLETTGAVGGRSGSDGLLLPSFPEVRRVLDYDALQLRPFAPQIQVWHRGRLRPAGSWFDRLRLARFLDGLRAEPAASAERPVIDLLRWKGGFSEAFIDCFWRPFLSVFSLDRSLAVSSRFCRLVLKAYSSGGLAVPANGMSAIAMQLAAGQPVWLGETAIEVGPGIVRLRSGEVLHPRAVVVATGPETAERLLPGMISPVQWRGATTLAYERLAPAAEPVLYLDGEGGGPVNHAMVLPAGPGQSAVTATAIGILGGDDAALDRRVRTQLADWFGETGSWRLVRIDRDPRALPDVTAGSLDPWQRTVRVRPGLAVCGAVHDNPTIDGVLTSGYRAAQAVMADLAAERA